MNAETVTFTAPLIRWSTDEHGNMRYIRIDGEAAEAISAHELVRRLELGQRRGFGSVKVNVTIGESRWSTSVFPPKEGGWFLPIKKAICRAEGLEDGADIEVHLELL
jgi:hypothetical protein